MSFSVRYRSRALRQVLHFFVILEVLCRTTEFLICLCLAEEISQNELNLFNDIMSQTKLFPLYQILKVIVANRGHSKGRLIVSSHCDVAILPKILSKRFARTC